MNRIGKMVWEILDELKLVEKAEVQCCGVTPYQGYILMQLLENNGISMQLLAERMRVAVSTMTRNIDKLEANGLVNRVKSGRDARVLEVVLTDQGRTAGEMVAGLWRGYFARIVQHLEPEEQQWVIRGLEVFLKGIRRAGCCCGDNDKEEKE